MKIRFAFLIFISIFSLSSCIEIFDDLTIHNDGSGTLKYNINLSSSKLKINSILALDSLDGKKVPSLAFIKEEITRIKSKFEKKEGISNVTISSDFVEYNFKLKCDFTNINNLQAAIKEIILEEKITKNVNDLSHNWITWDGQKLTRSIPELTINKTKNLNETEINLLKQGKYSSVTRFDRPVEKYENENSKLSPSQTALMLQSNTYSLTQNMKILENTIYLSPLK
jgi:arginine repressor